MDYLQTGKTINKKYYMNLLDQLSKKIREKRHGLAKKTVIFHQDNAPAHKNCLIIAKINILKYELIERFPYSSDLTSSDFHLFQNLKKFMRGQRFSSNEEVTVAVESYFESSRISLGIYKLEDCWTKCIEVQGDYTE